MKRLIIASADSSGGCLKAAGIAAKVVTLGIDFLMLPAPVTRKPLAFFAARKRLIEPQHYGWDHFVDGGSRTKTNLRRLAATARHYDRVEIWCDPDPSSQLQLMFLLSLLAEYDRVIAKLVLFHSKVYLGEQLPENVASWEPSFVPVDECTLQLARRVWLAFRQHTPEAVARLSVSPRLAVFPAMKEALIRVLRELPNHATGLTWTQTELLNAIADGETMPRRVFARLYPRTEKSPLDYWAQGHLLCGLATCERPSISGIDEAAFTLDLHDDRQRYDRFNSATISLTDLGHRIVAGADDFTRYNRIDFWWGGCRVTNDNLWRWDNVGQQLVGPR